MRSLPLRPAVALLAVVVTSCSTVAYREDVASRVDDVDVERLRAHVLALDAIGPRPIGDEEATQATVDWLASELRALDYQLEFEEFTMRRPGGIQAVVRRADDPSGEEQERLVLDGVGPAGQHVLRSIGEALREEGWEVELFRVVAGRDPSPLSLVNVIATKPGTDPDAPILELSAHYDTVPLSPGADDNSSGVAVLLEVARVVAQVPTERTIRFCFFGAEESGLVGSRAHVARVTERGDELVGVLNLDSVGFTRRGPDTQSQPENVPWFLALPDEADFVVVVGNWESGPLGNLFEDAADAYAPDLAYASYNRIGSRFADGHRSDHARYWRAGLPGILISDTTEFRGPHYHTPSDTPDTLDWKFLHDVARATAAFALHGARAIEPSAPVE